LVCTYSAVLRDLKSGAAFSVVTPYVRAGGQSS